MLPSDFCAFLRTRLESGASIDSLPIYDAPIGLNFGRRARRGQPAELFGAYGDERTGKSQLDDAFAWHGRTIVATWLPQQACADQDGVLCNGIKHRFLDFHLVQF